MSNDARARRATTRRQFLHTALAGSAVGIASHSGIDIAYAGALDAPAPASPPGTALQKLLEGNRRFATNHLTCENQNLRILKAQTIEKQEPFAGVLSCADSRVPVELVFDQTIGQIFVTRIAGNFVTTEIIASLEYAVAVLGIRVLLVLGHTNCGALKAAMKAETAPGQISSLYAHLRPAVEQSDGKVGKAIEANARVQAELLRSSSTVIRSAVLAGTLRVAAAVYDLGTGLVTLL